MTLTTQDTRKLVLAALRDIAPELASVAIDDHAPIRETYDLDSVDYLRFLVKLHERLNIEIPESSYPEFNSVAAIVNKVLSH